ncbi:unnamed protein product [Paramecium octaurelia]|uniref:Uncharacterized protein n=1 Tax=Paramecium octaurelia TaxID=43137 RepID=A0A8S1SRW8_PAROT|nr:unnamed protein product [Paramecium octaurelia]
MGWCQLPKMQQMEDDFAVIQRNSVHSKQSIDQLYQKSSRKAQQLKNIQKESPMIFLYNYSQYHFFNQILMSLALNNMGLLIELKFLIIINIKYFLNNQKNQNNSCYHSFQIKITLWRQWETWDICYSHQIMIGNVDLFVILQTTRVQKDLYDSNFRSNASKREGQLNSLKTALQILRDNEQALKK